jgi:hypothetical protein
MYVAAIVATAQLLMRVVTTVQNAHANELSLHVHRNRQSKARSIGSIYPRWQQEMQPPTFSYTL